MYQMWMASWECVRTQLLLILVLILLTNINVMQCSLLQFLDRDGIVVSFLIGGGVSTVFGIIETIESTKVLSAFDLGRGDKGDTTIK